MASFTPVQLPAAGGGKPIETIRVRFVIRPRRGQGGSLLRSMLRKGELCVSDEEVTFIKSHLRLFRSPVETTRVIPREQIFDVKIIRKYVYFDVHTPTGIQRGVLLAPSRAEAQKLLEWLGGQATPTHAAEQIALSRYSEQIVALAPVTWVTYGLIAINVLVYLAMCAGGVGVMAQNLPLTVKWGTNFGPYTLGGEWWRLGTSVFVHFGLIHLMLNMFSLYQIGRLAERFYGSGRFLALYLFAGVTGSIVSLLWHPTVNSAGASGAIFGVFGGLLVFVVKFRHELPTSIAVQQRASILVLIGYNLFYGFTHQGIDNGAHLGGLLGGTLLGLTLARPLNTTARTKVALESALFSAALAIFVLIGSTYPLGRSSAAAREELQFRNVVTRLVPLEQKALSDMLVLTHEPIATQSQRNVIAEVILREVVPQWEGMYATLGSTHLPANSPQTALRASMLRYFDDNRNLYRLTAQAVRNAPALDPIVDGKIKALRNDSRDQVAFIKKLAALNTGGHG
ncbi:rhomboid family intramembrane serine protease [Pseudomonas gingeri]|uniref:Rhomboid family intramembrane serine protease n=1 Tax=Pseudomonas gingeri TaxID=117681 RepID=A0A7Y7XBH1_9PSED|nr:rhomboid family intramembrane serine protease [Pseudomonas gingeri]NWB96727.1 rhomboid family intramembrane serine protease [Pseudomonas gingeri]